MPNRISVIISCIISAGISFTMMRVHIFNVEESIGALSHQVGYGSGHLTLQQQIEVSNNIALDAKEIAEKNKSTIKDHQGSLNKIIGTLAYDGLLYNTLNVLKSHIGCEDLLWIKLPRGNSINAEYVIYTYERSDYPNTIEKVFKRSEKAPDYMCLTPEQSEPKHY